MIQAQTQTPFAIRGRALLGAIALMVGLGLGAAGGYAVGEASARVTQSGTARTATGAYPFQLGPASRWTHEEQPFTPIQLGPASRWTHEERPFTPIQLGPALRSSHEEPFPPTEWPAQQQ